MPNSFDKFVDYVTARLTEAPHLRSAKLLDESRPLGVTRPYPTLTRHIWDRRLRPECTECAHVERGSLKPVSSSKRICTTPGALPARFSCTGNDRTSSGSVHVLDHQNVWEYARGKAASPRPGSARRTLSPRSCSQQLTNLLLPLRYRSQNEEMTKTPRPQRLWGCAGPSLGGTGGI